MGRKHWLLDKYLNGFCEIVGLRYCGAFLCPRSNFATEALKRPKVHKLVTLSCQLLENWQSKVTSYGATGFVRGVSSTTSRSKQEYQPIAKRHSLRCQVRHEYRLHRADP